MPDTLCRQCGGELDVAKKCFHCNHPIQMICTVHGTNRNQIPQSMHVSRGDFISYSCSPGIVI